MAVMMVALGFRLCIYTRHDDVGIHVPVFTTCPSGDSEDFESWRHVYGRNMLYEKNTTAIMPCLMIN